MMTLPTSIAKTHESFRRGTLTPRELLEQCFQRIIRHEPEVLAWVLLDGEGSFAVADRQTQELADGRFTAIPLPPLFGIPIGVKDIIDAAPWPTRAGSKIARSEGVERDAEVVRRLRDAGAILIGKTTTTEFACFDPASTRNPWNLGHTPGGSSSGSAAATASGMCVAAIGSQTGGSILRPASFCGIVGFKPSFGMVSTKGVVPVAASLDHVGPLTKCISDARTMFQVLAGRISDAATFSPSLPSPALPRRFGIVREFFFERAEAACAAIVEQAIGRVAGRLGTAEEVRSPRPLNEVHRVHRLIMAVECAAYHRRSLEEHRADYGKALIALIEEGLKVSGVDYLTARQGQAAFRRDVLMLLERYDALLMPTTGSGAPASLENTGDPRWQSPWSLAGVPSITLPCGIAPNGLPLGLQLVGADDERLLAVAQEVEEVLKFDDGRRALPSPLAGEGGDVVAG